MNHDLISRFNEREEESFKVIFYDIYPYMLRVAKTFITDHHQSEDITIVVFHKLFKSKAQFESYKDIKLYLLQSVKNECLNYIRLVQGKLRRIEELIDYDISDETESEPYLVYKLKDQINQLPEQYRRLLLLTLEGYTNKEICQITNMKQNTIDIQKHRAIKILKSLLNK